MPWAVTGIVVRNTLLGINYLGSLIKIMRLEFINLKKTQFCFPVCFFSFSQ